MVPKLDLLTTESRWELLILLLNYLGKGLILLATTFLSMYKENSFLNEVVIPACPYCSEALVSFCVACIRFYSPPKHSKMLGKWWSLSLSFSLLWQ